jgi:hypothetical protein
LTPNGYSDGRSSDKVPQLPICSNARLCPYLSVVSKVDFH